MLRRRVLVLLIAMGSVALLALSSTPASANHAWGNYHWARTANPFTLKLGDNVSGTWDSYLTSASNDWSVSSVLDTTVVAGQSNPRNCRPRSGQVAVCNSTYGNTGWLGIAQIWASGSHITQGAVKLNDTYFNTSTYNTTAWRNLVMCQEVGHTFGLAHQDENFNNANLGSCMDYTSNPGTNQHPNQHDYEQLETIYSHLDSTTTVAASAAAIAAARANGVPFADEGPNQPSDFGQAIRTDRSGRPILFVRDLGAGVRLFTWVTWA